MDTLQKFLRFQCLVLCRFSFSGNLRWFSGYPKYKRDGHLFTQPYFGLELIFLIVTKLLYCQFLHVMLPTIYIPIPSMSNAYA
jgi:hypothetical protein